MRNMYPSVQTGGLKALANSLLEGRLARCLSQKVSPWLLVQAMLLLILLGNSGCSKAEGTGTVMDVENSQPIANATIFHNGHVTQSDAAGNFKLEAPDLKKPLLVNAIGYRRISLPLKNRTKPNPRLLKFEAKALYLSHAALGAPQLRKPIMEQIISSDLNAVIVDVKGVRGLFSFSCEIPVGHKIGAFSRITMDDPDKFIRNLHEKDVYVIARISVFKDETLGGIKKEWAVINPKTQTVFRDPSDKIPWVDPFREEVWDYNLAMAKTAAEIGFDEIQFDNLRFPLGALKYSQESTVESRQQAILGFLKKARTELRPYNVSISVATSGNTIFRKGDEERMGQNLTLLAPLVDYVCPYIFPSDLPGRSLNLSTESVHVPGEAVTAALKIVIERVGDPAKVRPWLQAFKGYASARREYKEEEIGQQIAATSAAGAAGWMLFNPENLYPYTKGALDFARKPVVIPDPIAPSEPTVNAL